MAMAMSMPPPGGMHHPGAASFHQGFSSMPAGPGPNPYAMPRAGSYAVPQHQVANIGSPAVGTFSGMPGREMPRSQTMPLGPPMTAAQHFPSQPAMMMPGTMPPPHPQGWVSAPPHGSMPMPSPDFSETPRASGSDAHPFVPTSAMGLPVVNSMVMSGPPSAQSMAMMPQRPSFNSMPVPSQSFGPSPMSFASGAPTDRTMYSAGPPGYSVPGGAPFPNSASFSGGMRPGMVPSSQSFAGFAGGGPPPGPFFSEQPLSIAEAADMCQGSAYAEGAIHVAEGQAKNALLVTQQALKSLGALIQKETSNEANKKNLSQMDWRRAQGEGRDLKDQVTGLCSQAQKLTGDAMRTLTYITDMLMRNCKRAELAATRLSNEGEGNGGPASENRKDRSQMAHRYACQASQFAQSAACCVSDCLDQQNAAVSAASTEAKVAQINMSANAASKAATQAALASRVLAQASETILDLISGT